MTKLIWTDRARRDLLAIGRYIARDNPRAAREWVERLRKRARDAAKMPLTGRRVPEKDREEIREVLLRNYRIVYRVHEHALQVLTVFEGHRLFPGDVETNSDDSR
jgi:addiction module RelE/StbE family toxin